MSLRNKIEDEITRQKQILNQYKDSYRERQQWNPIPVTICKAEGKLELLEELLTCLNWEENSK